ncbi:MAG TPA: serine hydrolase domain-containing protein, partial [Gemmataceae bacterium]
MNPRMFLLIVSLISLSLHSGPARTEDVPRLPAADPADVGLDATKLGQIDAAVREGIEQGRLPGAVVLVVRQGKIAFHKVYGLRSKQPVEIRMTADTVFDLASLTKPIATATSAMILLEQGKLRLADPVSRHLPAFGQNGKERITIEHLLLHTSG